MTTYIYPYKQGSESAKALANALGIKKLKVEGSKFKSGADKSVINWGSSKIDNEEVLKSDIINHPDHVALVSNKLSFFNELSRLDNNDIVSINYPAYTTSEGLANGWLREGHVVLARTKLNAHSGEGIVIMTNPDELVEAPLYTFYVKKKSEFRAHFMNGEVFFYQQKVRRADHPDDKVDWMIRNHENGFNYAWQDVKIPENVQEQARLVANHIDLDFGAVDIIYNEKYNTAYVLEVNSAPGLTGETVVQYANAFNRHYLSKNPDVIQKQVAWDHNIDWDIPQPEPVNKVNVFAPLGFDPQPNAVDFLHRFGANWGHEYLKAKAEWVRRNPQAQG